MRAEQLTELKNPDYTKMSKEDLEERIMKTLKNLHKTLDEAHARMDIENATGNRKINQ